MLEQQVLTSTQQIVDTPENWDAASKGYAEKVAPYLMESFAQEHIDRLDLNGKTKTIEVAAGSGALTGLLAKNVKSLLATDFSPKMIGLAKRKIAKAGIANVEFEVMDGQALLVDDDTFDRAACSFGLMLFPDRHKGFSELYRILRPGGRAVVSGWAGPERFEAFGLFMEAIQKALPEFPKPTSPLPVFTLADPDNFKTQMEAAGFKEVEVDFVSKEMVLENFNSVWAMLTVGAPPVKILFDKVGADGKHRIHDALADIILKRFGSGPISISNSATIGSGNAA
jgi:ubiquinone/menaquinone biosynthesis C-methylase UbiE